MVMCGAVSAGLLTKVAFALVMVTIIGTSPAPASVAGKVKRIMSKPGASRFGLTSRIPAPMMSVVPVAVTIETFTSAAVALLTPVRFISNTVGTRLPLPSGDITLKGSAVGDMGFVTFRTAARPPASIVEVKMSG